LIESEFSKDASVSKPRFFTTGITTHSFRLYGIKKMENRGLSPEKSDNKSTLLYGYINNMFWV
jgi:hypothetical protein